MRLTTKGSNAVTATLDLALYAPRALVSLTDASERQGISLSYLEQLFAKLHRSRLASSVCSPGGGHQPSRDMQVIWIAQVIDAANESFHSTHCYAGVKRLIQHLWYDLSLKIYDFLDGTSLADLVNRREIQELAQHQDQRGCNGSAPHLDKIEASTAE